MEKVKSQIPYEYKTVRTTSGRIKKGLLAIPVSLVDFFPEEKRNIVLVNERGKEEQKKFTPYQSSSRECRIHGLREFYSRYSIQDGDELVIQFYDKGKIKLIPEKFFNNRIQAIENDIEAAHTEKEVERKLESLSNITNKPKEDIWKSEFIRLSSEKHRSRKVRRGSIKTKENVPLFIRKILLEAYKGHCQISNFTFLTKRGVPYFEVHHINPEKGHFIKNLLVVSPNVHAQFTHTNVTPFWDNEGWLRKVKFNEEEFFVRQAIDTIAKEYYKEVHFE
jgi:hypothetical protein